MPNKMKSNNPPRRVDIRGQDHLLAYITPAEAQLLMDNGGTGEPGPMGIPSFADAGHGGGWSGTGGNNSDSAGGRGGIGIGGGSGARSEDADAAAAEAVAAAEAAMATGTGKSYNELGISPGQSQAQFGTPGYAGLGQDQAINAALNAGNPFAVGVAASRAKDIQALQNFNKQLYDLSKRERIQQDRIRSPWSLIPGFGLMNYIGLQNVRNLASTAIGQPPGLFSGFGFGDRNDPNFSGLGVSDLIGLQSQAVTDDMGNIVGFRDEYGTLKYGRDPNDFPSEDRGPEIVPTQTNPVTGQEECPSGYTFDGDINACRIDAPLENVVGGTGFDYEPGTYARMGLLDISPEGLEQFASTYGTGFGTAPDYEAANLAYRKPVGTMSDIFQDPYNLQGMTLLA